jgi:hypothetical protein
MLISYVLSALIKFIRGIGSLLFTSTVLMQGPVRNVVPKGAGQYGSHQKKNSRKKSILKSTR